MTQHNAIKLFETKKVRTIWDDKDLVVNGVSPYFRILIRHLKS